MQNSSAFQYLAVDTIHESTTNPRRTFDEAKLQELADFVAGHKIAVLWRWTFCSRVSQSALGRGWSAFRRAHNGVTKTLND